MHTGSDILDAEVFLRAADILFEAAQEFPDLKFIDFGSGFKVAYREGDVTTDIEQLGARLGEAAWVDPGARVNRTVADIGYASVVGADRLSSAEGIYGNFPVDVAEGDTYGPFTYISYLPFELILPWSGEWDNLPAAHAAAIFFDLGTLLLLFLLGRRSRPGAAGVRLGAILAFGWAAYPYSALALETNSNDALVSLLLVGALLLAARPAWRGVTMAMAVLAKFAPLGALPILARLDPSVDGSPPAGSGRRSGPPRHLLRFTAGFAVAGLLLMVPVLIGSSPAEFFDRTLGYQAGRDSPFSIWGQVSALEPLRLALIAATVLLVLVTFWRPRRPGLVQAAALAAAILIGTQLVAQHWFYLYLVWFFPLALIAITLPRGRPLRGAFAKVTPARPEPGSAQTTGPGHQPEFRSAPP